MNQSIYKLLTDWASSGNGFRSWNLPPKMAEGFGYAFGYFILLFALYIIFKGFYIKYKENS